MISSIDNTVHKLADGIIVISEEKEQTNCAYLQDKHLLIHLVQKEGNVLKSRVHFPYLRNI